VKQTTRALVLGGGGITGIAWEVGVLRGLRDGGTDIERWDLVVGTSAGSVVGMRLLGEGGLDSTFESLQGSATLFDEAGLRRVAGRNFLRAVRAGRRRGLRWVPAAWLISFVVIALVRHAARRGIRPTVALLGSFRVRDPSPESWQRLAAALGNLALTARQDGRREWLEFWEEAVGPSRAWPATRFIATAVDARDGSRMVFDEASGLPLATAIAASTCLPFLIAPIGIGGRCYVDGGVASPTHADLARGYDEVLILAPVSSTGLADTIDELRADGSDVLLIRPGPASEAAIGGAMGTLDPARGGPAARAGYADGLAAARA
jgi:NTE family protein